MLCTNCPNIDRRNGECQQLRHMVLCQQCHQTYEMTDIRCPQCALASTTLVAGLEHDGEDFIASEYCPLSQDEREALVRKQDGPVKVQGELF